MNGFYKTYYDILESADDCLKKRRIVPCLILIYSAIDSISIISNKTNSSGKKSFKEWVKKWMLDKYPLPCNETDLYGARCGLLHQHKSQSGLSEKGEAKKIYYSWGNADNKIFQDSIQSGSIALKIEDLINSFRKGFADCFSEIQNDQEWILSFKEKAKDMLVSIDSEIITKHNKGI